ncbi:ABC transporter substrate-binding protein [Truepera radiovictrix]|uniref:Extracellular solute-binding protein family 1 n=1 Tax=Truepera radiovictrix (strain DSM 17093 / CIP 108686 / LMG 22925 / RQ-24) TaxID=649638 RepID=D7CTJ8_TRURR|nr:ABC transporter substrate-binding protein [Truepera radiovictrix]ADI13855.1 extracellular solute-binding protein family 1 [Truepera radiovictrix DSM 17093]WMT57581.1 ABC transporter substrate-binding protein [Truepera radiovictrix]
MTALLLTGGLSLAQVTCSEEASGAQITFWNGFSGPDGEFMTQMVNAFNQENEQGVSVNMTIQPFTDYYNTVNAALASRTLPDVLQVHLDQIATQAVRGTIRPLDEALLETLGVRADDYPEAVWNGTQYNGERYAVPLDIHPLVMWYNRDAWEAAGLEDPAGRVLGAEEYRAALEALSEQGEGAVAWSVTTGFPITWMFEILLYQFGGDRFNEDGTEVAYNSEAGVQALTYLRDAQAAFSRPNLPVDAGVTAFKQGQSYTEWNGTWQLANLTGEGFAPGWGAPIPNIGGTYAVTAGAHTLALGNTATEDPAKTAAASCFIGYLSTNSLEWVAGAGHIPASLSVRESEAFQALEAQASYAVMADAAVFPPTIPGITDALAPLAQAVEAVMAGQQTDIQAALNDAAAQGNQILEQNRQRYGGR